MTDGEVTQALNLARVLKLVVSSRVVSGKLHVYDSSGRIRSWESFISDYPLERLQAMVQRARLRDVS